MLRFHRSQVRMLCAAALAALPLVAQAQATLAVAEASRFIGSWTLMLDTPQGSMPVTLNVKDNGGQVAGEVGSDLMPTQAITSVSKSAESLVLSYTLDFQGNAVPVKISLTPDGDKMKFSFDAADGQFVVEGPATKL
jgi:hypothetical protein